MTAITRSKELYRNVTFNEHKWLWTRQVGRHYSTNMSCFSCKFVVTIGICIDQIQGASNFDIGSFCENARLS